MELSICSSMIQPLSIRRIQTKIEARKSSMENFVPSLTISILLIKEKLSILTSMNTHSSVTCAVSPRKRQPKTVLKKSRPLITPLFPTKASVSYLQALLQSGQYVTFISKRRSVSSNRNLVKDFGRSTFLEKLSDSDKISRGLLMRTNYRNFTTGCILPCAH